MKNKWVIAAVVLANLTSCGRGKVSLFLGEAFSVRDGDFFAELQEETGIAYNHEFALENFYMKLFYQQLEQEAMNLTSGNSILGLLENSDRIVVNIGNYELLRLLAYSEYSLSYDAEVVRTSREMFEYYLNSSMEILTSYCQDILLLSMFPSLILEGTLDGEYRALVRTYNDIVQEAAVSFGAAYVPIEKASRFVVKNNVLSVNGGSYIVRQIKEAYGTD